VSFVVLLIVGIVIFVVISNVMRGTRGTAARVATLTPKGENQNQALRSLLESQIESGADVREVLRAVRAAKSREPDVSVTFSSENAAQLADSLRVALGVATVAAAEQIVTAKPAKKKHHKVAAQPDATFEGPRGVPPLAVLSMLEPLPVIHPRRPLAPKQPLSPLAAHSARS
jgi:hypothetical protein